MVGTVSSRRIEFRDLLSGNAALRREVLFRGLRPDTFERVRGEATPVPSAAAAPRRVAPADLSAFGPEIVAAVGALNIDGTDEAAFNALAAALQSVERLTMARLDAEPALLDLAGPIDEAMRVGVTRLRGMGEALALERSTARAAEEIEVAAVIARASFCLQKLQSGALSPQQIRELTQTRESILSGIARLRDLPAPDDTPIGRVYRDIDAAGQLTDGDGHLIRRAELVRALRELLAGTNRLLNAGDAVDASIAAHQQVFGVTSIGELAEVMGLPAAEVAPLVIGALSSEQMLTRVYRQLLERYFDVTLPDEEPTSEEEVLGQLDVAARALLSAMDGTMTPAELNRQLLIALQDGEAHPAALAPLERTLRERATVPSITLTAVRTWLAAHPGTSRDDMREAARDLTLPPLLREGLYQFSHSDDLWTLGPDDARRYLVNGSIPMNGFFAGVDEVMAQIRAARSGADVLRAIEPLSAAQGAFLLGVMADFNDEVSDVSSNMELADIATRLTLGPDDGGESTRERYSRNAAIAERMAENDLQALERTVENARERWSYAEMLVNFGTPEVGVEEVANAVAAARAAVGTPEFAELLNRAERLERRLVRRIDYEGERLHARGLWLRDTSAAIAVAAAATAAALATSGAIIAAGSFVPAEVPYAVIASSATLRAAAGWGIAASVGAGAAAYAPVAALDAITGNEEGNFGFGDALLTSVTAGMASSFSLAAPLLLPQRLAASPMIRALTLGAGNAAGTSIGSALSLVTASEEERWEILSNMPLEALRAFVSGTVLGGIGGRGGIVADAALGGVEHAIWQTLQHRDITDGLVESMLGSAALGSISRAVRLRSHLRANPPRRGTRVELGEGRHGRIVRVRGDRIIVNEGGRSRAYSFIELARHNPRLASRPEAPEVTPARREPGYRDPAAPSTPAIDYANAEATIGTRPDLVPHDTSLLPMTADGVGTSPDGLHTARVEGDTLRIIDANNRVIRRITLEPREISGTRSPRFSEDGRFVVLNEDAVIDFAPH